MVSARTWPRRRRCCPRGWLSLLHALGWLRPVLSVDVSKLGLVGSDDSVYYCRTHPSLTVRKQSKGSSLQSRPLVLLDLSLLERYSLPYPQLPLSTRCSSPAPHPSLSALARHHLSYGSSFTLSPSYLWDCAEVLFCLFLHEDIWYEALFTMALITRGCGGWAHLDDVAPFRSSARDCG